MRSGPWNAAVAVLLPLVPGALMAWRPMNEGFGVLLLLAAVVAACRLGGVTAGAAAAVLAVLIDNLLLLPPRLSLTVTSEPAHHLVAFAVAAAGIVVVYARVRSARAGTEQARAAAERRASALTERVDMLAPLLDDAPIGFGLMDRDLRFRYVNAQFAGFSERPVADHIGHTAGDVFGAEFGHLAEQIVARVVETGQTERTIQLGVPRGGRQRQYLTNRYPVRDSGGWIIGVGFGAIDVTERVELEESYRRASAELTATIRSSPVAIALLGTDLCFRHVNREFQRLAGDPDRDLAGRALADADGLPPVVLAMPAGVLETGESGGAVDVPTGPGFTTVNCFPVRTEDETLVGVALVVVDVTEQHRIARLEAEAQTLRATAELAVKLEQAQRLAGLGNWELDLATGQLTWTDGGATETRVGALHGLTVHPDDAERATRLRRRLLREGVPFVDEFRLIRPDGSVIDVYCTGEAVPDETGRPARVWGTFQDVTAQRATERAAKDARAQLEAERQALQMFVRAMLPPTLPEVAGAELAASYRPAARVDIGGDWFDSFRLPDGRLALAVGDVTGHDLRAATVMGQVRNAVRAYAFEDPAPGEVLRRTDRLLCQIPELGQATMVYGVYDPVSQDLTWANAGHPAPLLRHGRDVSALADPGGALLGVFGAGVRYAEATVRLEPGDTVLWFTDGLVDNRGTDPAAATRCLMSAFAGADDSPDRLLAQVTERMLTDGTQDDDVCLLALHRQAQPATLRPAARASRGAG